MPMFNGLGGNELRETRIWVRREFLKNKHIIERCHTIAVENATLEMGKLMIQGAQREFANILAIYETFMHTPDKGLEEKYAEEYDGLQQKLQILSCIHQSLLHFSVSAAVLVAIRKAQIAVEQLQYLFYIIDTRRRNGEQYTSY
jgi:hypothetical protein